MQSFSYDDAFSRNIGWVTAEEQQSLRRKRAAIAGLGGVGGAHLLALTRLGVGAFHIADSDAFDLPNFNRQAGALVSTLGRPKTDVLANMARDSDDPRSVAGILVASMLGRGFLIALTLLGVGLVAGNKAGLCAAVLFLAAFTISFGMGIALRPFEQGPPRV